MIFSKHLESIPVVLSRETAGLVASWLVVLSYDFTIDGTSKRWYSKAIESYKRVIEVNNDGPLGLEASAELKAFVNQLFLNR